MLKYFLTNTKLTSVILSAEKRSTQLLSFTSRDVIEAGTVKKFNSTFTFNAFLLIKISNHVAEVVLFSGEKNKYRRMNII